MAEPFRDLSRLRSRNLTAFAHPAACEPPFVYPSPTNAEHRRAWLQMHCCVLLRGFTGILGKLITLHPLALVWWRMLIVTGALLFVRRFWAGLLQMSSRTIVIFAGIGLLLSLPWVTFYAAIKLANASVAATCMAITPVIIALLEPVITRTGNRRRSRSALLR